MYNFLQFVPHTTMIVIVTPRVVTVEEMMFVTMWLVTAHMDVNHIGMDQYVTVTFFVTMKYAKVSTIASKSNFYVT